MRRLPQDVPSLQRLLVAVLADRVGQENLEMAVAYHDREHSQAELAIQYGISPQMISTRIRRVRRILRSHGLMPEHWERATSEAA